MKKLIIEREKYLKGARSRFTNKKALEQWRGAAGVNELRYRWPTAKQFLKDLEYCEKIEEEKFIKLSFRKKLRNSIFKVFSPIM